MSEEKNGWIFIGEVEFKYNPFSPYRDEEPVFLYIKSSYHEIQNKMWYYYGFGRGIKTPTYLTFLEFDKRYSIITVLQYFISHDQEFSSPQGRRIQYADTQACRLSGMQEWIYPNKEFLNCKIEIEDLEKNWRSDKEKKVIEKYQNNKYASKEDKERILKEGAYKI